MPGKLEVRRTLFLKASPGKVWRALTDARIAPRYYYGMRGRFSLRKGGGFSYLALGEEMIRGRVLSIEPKRKLTTSFAFTKLARDAPSKVTFEVRRFGKATQLTFVHDGFRGNTTTYRWAGGWWDWVLSGFKTLVETGGQLKA